MSSVQEYRDADAKARLLAQVEFSSPLILEAGAGTGKTATLVARILAWSLGPGWEKAERELAEDPRLAKAIASGQFDRIAQRVLKRITAITFTDAAAAEMATRVGEALVAIEKGELPVGVDASVLPDDLEMRRQRARDLLGFLDQLAVSTIHAFCRRLLAEHPLEVGLHPRFELDAEQTHADEIIQEVLEQRIREGDSVLVELALLGLGTSDIAQTLQGFVQQGVRAEDFPENPVSSEAIRSLLEKVSERFLEWNEFIGPQLVDVERQVKSCKRSTAVAKALDDSVGRMSALLTPEDDLSPEVLEVVGECWPTMARNALGQWKAGKFNSGEGDTLSEEEQLFLVVESGPLLRTIEHLDLLDPERLLLVNRALKSFVQEIQELFRVRGVESFSDLLRDARDLLVRSAVVRRTAQTRIDQLLVDEFQDTDSLQCDLIRALAFEGDDEDRPGLFLVGDPKQSIYGWRSADLRAYDQFVAAILEEGGQRKYLVVNYRSLSPILDEVERVVSPVMQPAEGLQPEFQPLICSEEKLDREVPFSSSFHPIEYWVARGWDSEEKQCVDLRAKESNALEARCLTRDLQRLHEEEGVAWKDMAILFRSTGDTEDYLRVMRAAGVPYAESRSQNYYRRREIIEASAFVCSLFDPTDHLSLLTWMRSAWVGVPDAALLLLWERGFPRCVTELYAALPSDLEAMIDSAASALIEKQEAEKSFLPGLDRVSGWAENLKYALRGLGELRATVNSDSADGFVEKLRTTLLMEVTEAARSLGIYRIANLERFFRDLCTTIEDAEGDAGLILHSLRFPIVNRSEAEEERPKDALEDAVQVMTIHKAKGLDFQHVYLVQLHKGTRPKGERDVLAESRGDRFEYRALGVRTLGLLGVLQQKDEIESNERVRSLYVAMTRAKQRLVLIGSWPLKDRSLVTARTHADLLLHRKAGIPPLSERMSTLAESTEKIFVDEYEARWVFLGLDHEEPRAQCRQQAPLPSCEEIARVSQSLQEKRASALQRQARPFSLVASERVNHETAAGSKSTGFAHESSRRLRQAIGTAVHRVFEEIDLDKKLADALEEQRHAVARYLDGLVGCDESDEARAGVEAVLTAAYEGGLVEKLFSLHDSIVARELPVLLPVEDGLHGSGPLGFSSGVLDLLYRDPQTGDLVVADYKTDALGSPEALEERARSYAPQGLLYCRAVEQALELPQLPRFELWFLREGVVHLDGMAGR